MCGHMPDHSGPFARNLSADAALKDRDMDRLARLHRRRCAFLPGHGVTHAGRQNASAVMRSEGWALSYRLMPDGECQIVGFQGPGGFPGFRSVLFRSSDDGIKAVIHIDASRVRATDIPEGFGAAGAPPEAMERPALPPERGDSRVLWPRCQTNSTSSQLGLRAAKSLSSWARNTLRAALLLLTRLLIVPIVQPQASAASS